MKPFKLLPSYKQFEKWSLPSKYAFFSVLLAILIPMGLAFLGYLVTDEEKFKSALIANQEALIESLAPKDDLHDSLGLSLLQIGDAYKHLKETRTYLTSLKFYRKAMLMGDENAKKRVYDAYSELILAMAGGPGKRVDFVLFLDGNDVLKRFEAHPMSHIFPRLLSKYTYPTTFFFSKEEYPNGLQIVVCKNFLPIEKSFNIGDCIRR